MSSSSAINNNSSIPQWSSVQEQQQNQEAQTAYYSASAYEENKLNPLQIEEEEEKPFFEEQLPQCHDVPYAIAFIIQLSTVVYIAAKYVPLMEESLFNHDQNNNQQQQYRALKQVSEYYQDFQINILEITKLVLTSGITALILNFIMLPVILYCSKSIIYICLMSSIGISIFTIITGIYLYIPTMTIAGVLLLLFTCYYTWVVWSRIPYTAANLCIACTAVQSNAFSLSFYAYLSLILLFAWTLIWSLAFVSASYAQMQCQGHYCQLSHPSALLVIMFLISFFWTFQVVKNHLHTTVAGTVGYFWNEPSSVRSCCSPAVRRACFRSSTTSFGSICYGSLFVSIVTSLKDFLTSLQRHNDDVYLCCAEFILSCLKNLILYFHQWAFCFVGLYHYNFCEAGQNVMTLFHYRKWDNIILLDSLVDSVLTMLSICIGFVTACVASMAIQTNLIIAPWIIGFGIGFILASTLMSLLGSAVNTVIVCFADKPDVFQKNYPKLYDILCDSWKLAWPDDFKY